MITEIILASSSPRREQLLRQVGCSFRVLPSGAAEDNAASLSPAALVKRHARAKALDVAGRSLPADVVVGADTIVVLDGKVYGKPAGPDEAIRMLTELSGRTHSVWSGLAVVSEGTCLTDAVETKVTLAPMSLDQIRAYVATGEPVDKAGAYAIQGIGALWVERIEGCYSNVVGLPLNRLAGLLSRAGVKLL